MNQKLTTYFKLTIRFLAALMDEVTRRCVKLQAVLVASKTEKEDTSGQTPDQLSLAECRGGLRPDYLD